MKADIRRQRHEKVIAALLATSTREEAAESWVSIPGRSDDTLMILNF